jgi:hypothetical protein
MVNLYVGITDYDWFRFLAAQPGVDEVNFWQPGGAPISKRCDLASYFYSSFMRREISSSAAVSMSDQISFRLL